MGFLTVLMWVIGLGLLAVVVFAFIGGVMSEVEKDKAIRYLADQYDREQRNKR